MNRPIKNTHRHQARQDAALRQRAFSLIELVSVMAFMGMLLSLAATTLNRAYHVHHTTLKAFRELEQLNFWYERLVSDAHQAVACEIASAAVFSRGDGQSVRYLVEQQQLVRIIERGTQTLSKEVLHSSPLAGVNWSRNTQGLLPLLICELRFDHSQTTREPILWQASMPLNQSPLSSSAVKEDSHDS